MIIMKAQRRDQYAITSQLVPIERTKVKFPLNKKNDNSSPLIHRTPFPLMSSYAMYCLQITRLDIKLCSFQF